MYFFDNTGGSARNRNRGFTLMLAALVSAIVLALGSSIYSIARKQVTLSAIGRDSQFAFYAADTIIECVLYHDVRFAAFATSSAPAPSTPVTCDGVELTKTVLSADSTSAVTRVGQNTIFTEDEDGNPQNGNCVEVIVTKDDTATYPTVLHADGYSSPCDTISNSQRTLQRSIEIRY